MHELIASPVKYKPCFDCAVVHEVEEMSWCPDCDVLMCSHCSCPCPIVVLYKDVDAIGLSMT
jgi:hypothetical protein